MLVIDAGTRSQSYCLLLLSHVDIERDEVRKQAAKYGVEDLVEDLLTYLDTMGDQRAPMLPEWAAFRDLELSMGLSV